MPHRGERNEPLYTTFVAKKMSQLLQIELNQIEDITTENALKLFDI
jgi:TatD DNase family protein